MHVRPASSARPQPVHAFKPSSGMLLGSMGLAIAGLVVVLVLASERSLPGLRAALGAALVALVIWMVLLRPRVTAYADTLVLRNMISEVHVPLVGIEDVAVRHVLHVWVADERYSCAGIGRSTRSLMRSPGSSTEAGRQDYVTFVETTIDELARSARRDARAEPDVTVRRRWAVPELTAAGVLVVALALSLVVG